MKNDPMKELAGINIKADVIYVKHADLKKDHPDRFATRCPACEEGVLAGRRNPKTAELLSTDICLLCGQAVIYLDIQELKLISACSAGRL